MALLARGVFPVPLDPRLTTHERTRVLDGVRPDLVIDSPDAAADLLATLDPSPGPTAHRSLPRARPMHVTSGTTGTPKRTEESSVGKEWVSTCRSRWSP